MRASRHRIMSRNKRVPTPRERIPLPRKSPRVIGDLLQEVINASQQQRGIRGLYTFLMFLFLLAFSIFGMVLVWLVGREYLKLSDGFLSAYVGSIVWLAGLFMTMVLATQALPMPKTPPGGENPPPEDPDVGANGG